MNRLFGRFWPLVFVLFISGCVTQPIEDLPSNSFEFSPDVPKVKIGLVKVGFFEPWNSLSEPRFINPSCVITFNVETEVKHKPWIRLRIQIKDPATGRTILDTEELFQVKNGAFPIRPTGSSVLQPRSSVKFTIRMHLIKAYGYFKARFSIPAVTLARQPAWSSKRREPDRYYKHREERPRKRTSVGSF